MADTCITYSCSHDREQHDLDFVQVDGDWVEAEVDPKEERGYCRTCWTADGLECRFSDEPSEAQLERMYSSDGPSARETYMRDWQQHQELHR